MNFDGLNVAFVIAGGAGGEQLSGLRIEPADPGQAKAPSVDESCTDPCEQCLAVGRRSDGLIDLT